VTFMEVEYMVQSRTHTHTHTRI